MAGSGTPGEGSCVGVPAALKVACQVAVAVPGLQFVPVPTQLPLALKFTASQHPVRSTQIDLWYPEHPRSPTRAMRGAGCLVRRLRTKARILNAPADRQDMSPGS